MPFGWSRTLYGPHPIHIVEDADKFILLAEQNTWFTIVYTDGRPHDKELPPTWYGDTVGHWEGDKLVLETVNLNGYAKVDTIGHPYSSKLKITQTYTRPNFGTIIHTWTVDDPKTYTRPWTVTRSYRRDRTRPRMLVRKTISRRFSGARSLPGRRPKEKTLRNATRGILANYTNSPSTPP
jgi:hypothetical protein